LTQEKKEPDAFLQLKDNNQIAAMAKESKFSNVAISARLLVAEDADKAIHEMTLIMGKRVKDGYEYTTDYLKAQRDSLEKEKIKYTEEKKNVKE